MNKKIDSSAIEIEVIKSTKCYRNACIRDREQKKIDETKNKAGLEKRKKEIEKELGELKGALVNVNAESEGFWSNSKPALTAFQAVLGAVLADAKTADAIKKIHPEFIVENKIDNSKVLDFLTEKLSKNLGSADFLRRNGVTIVQKDSKNVVELDNSRQKTKALRTWMKEVLVYQKPAKK